MVKMHTKNLLKKNSVHFLFSTASHIQTNRELTRCQCKNNQCERFQIMLLLMRLLFTSSATLQAFWLLGFLIVVTKFMITIFFFPLFHWISSDLEIALDANAQDVHFIWCLLSFFSKPF